jgi:cell division protein FtsZ
LGQKGKSHKSKEVGGGNNAVKNMCEKGIAGIDFIICNTDLQVLNRNPYYEQNSARNKLTKWLGAGCKPEIGGKATLESLDES